LRVAGGLSARGEEATPNHESPLASNSKKAKAVFTISSNGEGKKFWHRIGVAFVNKDESLTVKLDALPVNAELHIRDFPEREDAEAREG